MRAALVGAGGRGRARARALAGAGALAAVCDPGPAGAECGREHGVPRHASLAPMIAAGGFEAAVVCAPAAERAGIAGELVGAGKHVLVCGPAALTGAGARRLEEAAAGAGVTLASWCDDAFNPAVGAAAAEAGRLGGAAALEVSRRGPPPPGGGDGILLEASVHDIDTAMRVLGGPPEVVFARAGGAEGGEAAAVVLGFPGGRTASLSASWLDASPSRSLAAACRGATVVADLEGGGVRAGGGAPLQAGGAAGAAGAEVRAFLGAAGGGAPAAGGGAAAAEAAEAALLSGRTGAPVYMEAA